MPIGWIEEYESTFLMLKISTNESKGIKKTERDSFKYTLTHGATTW